MHAFKLAASAPRPPRTVSECVQRADCVRGASARPSAGEFGVSGVSAVCGGDEEGEPNWF